jgi:SAM-dependent methyltransferase
MAAVPEVSATGPNVGDLPDRSFAIFQRNLDKGANLWAAQNWPDRSFQSTGFEAVVDEIDFNGQRILDVGCGIGDFTTYLDKRGIVPARLRGIDALPDFVAEAKRTAPSWAEYKVGDILKDTDIYSSDWDWVIVNGVVQALLPEQREVLLKQCWRVARRGCAYSFLSARSVGSDIPYNAGLNLSPGEIFSAPKLTRIYPSDAVDEALTLFQGGQVRLRHDFDGDAQGLLIAQRVDLTFDSDGGARRSMEESNLQVLKKTSSDDGFNQLVKASSFSIPFLILPFIQRRRDEGFKRQPREGLLKKMETNMDNYIKTVEDFDEDFKQIKADATNLTMLQDRAREGLERELDEMVNIEKMVNASMPDKLQKLEKTLELLDLNILKDKGPRENQTFSQDQLSDMVNKFQEQEPKTRSLGKMEDLNATEGIRSAMNEMFLQDIQELMQVNDTQNLQELTQVNDTQVLNDTLLSYDVLSQKLRDVQPVRQESKESKKDLDPQVQSIKQLADKILGDAEKENEKKSRKKSKK